MQEWKVLTIHINYVAGWLFTVYSYVKRKISMATEPYLGTLTAFGGNFTIENWAVCWGQVLAIQENTALFSLLGDMYGGDSRTSFGLPDLRGRSPVGMGQLPGGYFYQQGVKRGVESLSLTLAQLPTHSHEAVFTPAPNQGIDARLEAATNGSNTVTPNPQTYLAANSSAGYYQPSLGPTNLVEISGLTVSGGGSGGTVTVGDTGSSNAVEVINPVLPINWLISMYGVYPPRS
ncbi:phage tail protein [Vibrio navarrensis]|uniref:phage tail protein n=1 Tax=Vibrio navarrensis TaxID=29495 RepID=UPI001E575BBF|nr:tail fiber protein [Vibrio navarrensis]